MIGLMRRRAIILKSDSLSPSVLSVLDNYKLGKNSNNQPTYNADYLYCIVSISIPKIVTDITFSAGRAVTDRLFGYMEDLVANGYYPMSQPMPRAWNSDVPVNRIDITVYKLNRNNSYILDSNTNEYIWRGSKMKDWGFMVIKSYYTRVIDGAIVSNASYCMVIIELSESVNNLRFSTGYTGNQPGLVGFDDSTPHDNTFITGVSGKYDSTGVFLSSKKLVLAVYLLNKNDAYIYDVDREKYIFQGSEFDWVKYGIV